MGALHKVHSNAHGNPRRQTKNQKLSWKKKTKVGIRQYHERCKPTKATDWTERKRSSMDRCVQQTQNEEIQAYIYPWDPYPNDLQLAEADQLDTSINIKWIRTSRLVKDETHLPLST